MEYFGFSVSKPFYVLEKGERIIVHIPGHSFEDNNVHIIYMEDRLFERSERRHLFKAYETNLEWTRWPQVSPIPTHTKQPWVVYLGRFTQTHT